jgi:hypothetical protein
MMTRVSLRWAVCAAVLTVAFSGATIAHAQGAVGAGAGSSASALPAQPSPMRASSANSSSLPAAANTSASASSDDYEPITGEQRLEWLAKSTLYPKSLIAGLFSAAIGTGLDHPREDGPHSGGFGERYGIRLTGIATSDTMEVALGALWGEDPRYKREPEKSFGGRLGSVVEQGFMTRRRDGHFAPAYARYLAVSGSNFLSNTWRADSEADSTHAGYRIGLGFAGQIGSNAWDEFWPSISSHIFHKH